MRITAIHVERLLRSWIREPGLLLQSLFFPAALLFVFHTTLDSTALLMGGEDQIFSLVAMISLMGAAFGSVVAAEALYRERQHGLPSRFWVLPGPHYSVMLARYLAEFLRAFLVTLCVVAVGIVLGLNLGEKTAQAAGISLWQLWLAVFLATLIPSLFLVGFAPITMTLVLGSKGSLGIEIFYLLVFVLMFFNPGLMPTAAYPNAVQPFVDYQPLSLAVKAMSRLFQGHVESAVVLQLFAWIVALFLIFGTIALKKYRTVATNS